MDEGYRPSMTEDTTPVESQPRAVALSKELSEFLLEFSIGVHRYAMYPPDHPSLVPAAGNVMRKLAGILSDRRTLSIGVAHHQLVIPGLATESKHPVLADLSRRLHEHQLGAVSFGRGTAVGEVEALLDTLAQDSEREGQPLGLLPPEEFPRWAHITLYPVGYEKLELVDEGEGGELEPDGSTELWLGLARAAMGSDGEIDPNLPPASCRGP